MASVLFHPGAQTDYAEALAWYQARSPQAAVRFEDEIERTLASIEAHPEGFPKYDDEHRFALLRRFPFSVVYQAQPGCVYVIAIAHGSRTAGYWRDRA